ncbi:MAG: hypothetical protein KDH96_03100 [Candidatus Riesia sp.]|nr:hypothetical protein [Candidatus Riesia sp.]
MYSKGTARKQMSEYSDSGLIELIRELQSTTGIRTLDLTLAYEELEKRKKSEKRRSI